MKILSVDTSEPSGSAAVAIDGRTSEALSLGRSSSHLVELGRAVDVLTKKARIEVTDIDRIAVVTGPGSFTGLRIGMAYVKGLFAAFGPEIVVITSLELLAAGAQREDLPVSPMIDARRDEVYAALYEPLRGQECGEDKVVAEARSPERQAVGRRGILDERISPRAVSPIEHIGSLDVRPTIFVGSGALRYAGEIKSVFGSSAVFTDETAHKPDTRLLCEIAEGFDPLSPEDVISLEPFYIRPSDATLKSLKLIRTNDRH